MILLLIKLFLVVITTTACTTMAGWFIHWVFHRTWSLWFYSSHMNHHKIQYPPTDFISKKYRSAGKDNTVILFGLAFIPLLAMIIASMFFGLLSVIYGFVMLSTIGILGWLHDHIHDQFHIAGSWWERFGFFAKWRELHFIHHLDMNVNYGIILYQWDKLFHTFEITQDNLLGIKESDHE